MHEFDQGMHELNQGMHELGQGMHELVKECTNWRRNARIRNAQIG